MTPTNEAGHGLPELPEWSKRDDLGGLVPLQIRSELRAYARAALALSRVVPADMVLVPREPTEAMLDAADTAGDWGYDSLGGRFDNGNGDEIWAAMIKAAPAAAGAQGEDDDRSQVVAYVEEGESYPGRAFKALVWADHPANTPGRTFTPLYFRQTEPSVCPQCFWVNPQPAAADGGVRERARELSDLIDRYWNLAYAEGKEGRDHDTDNGDAALCRYEIEKHLRALSSHRQAGDDSARMDWLCSMAVEVRTPLRYGSRELFHAQTDSDDGEDHHTTLREQIDAQLALVEKGAGS